MVAIKSYCEIPLSQSTTSGMFELGTFRGTLSNYPVGERESKMTEHDPYWRPNPLRLSDHLLTVAGVGGRTLENVIDEWNDIGIALQIKPSLLMAAIRDAEIKAHGQPKPTPRRMRRWYSVGPSHLTTIGSTGRRDHIRWRPLTTKIKVTDPGTNRSFTEIWSTPLIAQAACRKWERIGYVTSILPSAISIIE